MKVKSNQAKLITSKECLECSEIYFETMEIRNDVRTVKNDCKKKYVE